MVGMEGVYGMVMSGIIITVATFIRCPFQDKSCVFNA